MAHNHSTRGPSQQQQHTSGGRPARAAAASAALQAVAAMHDGDDSHDSRAGSDDEEYEDGGGEEEEDEEHDSGGDEQHGASAAAAVAVGAASSSGPARSRSGSRSNSAKKKRRITQACDPCRRRKRKCDGAQPVCSACTRLKLVCGYQAAVKKRGPPAGIVKRLRQSVQALESELSHEQMQARLAKLASSGIAAPHAKQQMTEQHQAQSLHPSSSPRATNAHDVVAAAAAGAASDDDAAAADGLLDGSALTLSAAANSSVRNRTYLQTYFTLLNNTMLPLLDESSFFAEQARYESDPSLPVPLSWNLRFGAALSMGAHMYGDTEYAVSAARVARHAAAQLFDQPEPLVLRGMLLLAFHCLSTNQQSRAACYLAVAIRMCNLVESISPEVPVLGVFLEDMLCSINSWYTGFVLVPPSGYAAEQRAAYPEDKAEYDALLVCEQKRIEEVSKYELRNIKPHARDEAAQEQAQAAAAAGSAAAAASSVDATVVAAAADAPMDVSRSSEGPGAAPTPRPESGSIEPSPIVSATPNIIGDGSGHPSSLHADAPPADTAAPSASPAASTMTDTAADDAAAAAAAAAAAHEDAHLRWSLLKVMCFLSGTRGEFQRNPPYSLYRCLIILTRAFISPLTVGAVRTLIVYFLMSILRMLAPTVTSPVDGSMSSPALVAQQTASDDGEDELAAARRMANLATLAAQQHDTSHCPFYALCFHGVAQVHLEVLCAMPKADGSPVSAEVEAVQRSAEEHLALDLDIVEQGARKWEFSVPIMHNLHARIVHKYLAIKRAPKHPLLIQVLRNNQVDLNALEGGNAGPARSLDALVGGGSSSSNSSNGVSSSAAAAMEDVLIPGMSAADRARASAIFTSTTVPVHSRGGTVASSGAPQQGLSQQQQQQQPPPQPSIADTMSGLNAAFAGTLRLADAELVNMQQVRSHMAAVGASLASSSSSSSVPAIQQTQGLMLLTPSSAASSVSPNNSQSSSAAGAAGAGTHWPVSSTMRDSSAAATSSSSSSSSSAAASRSDSSGAAAPQAVQSRSAEDGHAADAGRLDDLHFMLEHDEAASPLALDVVSPPIAQKQRQRTQQQVAIAAPSSYPTQALPVPQRHSQQQQQQQHPPLSYASPTPSPPAVVPTATAISDVYLSPVYVPPQPQPQQPQMTMMHSSQMQPHMQQQHMQQQHVQQSVYAAPHAAGNWGAQLSPPPPSLSALPLHGSATGGGMSESDMRAREAELQAQLQALLMQQQQQNEQQRINQLQLQQLQQQQQQLRQVQHAARMAQTQAHSYPSVHGAQHTMQQQQPQQHLYASPDKPMHYLPQPHMLQLPQQPQSQSQSQHQYTPQSMQPASSNWRPH